MKKIVIFGFALLALFSCWGNNDDTTSIEGQTEEILENTGVTVNEGTIEEDKTEELVEYVVDESDLVDGKDLIKDLDATWKITEGEKAWLILMREEEKLAHDVYITMYEKWGQKIFFNISKSEQTHTEAVLALLKVYNIEDPVKNWEVWVFTSEKLQKLYNDLVEKWNNSLLDALVVGITVEDLDIYDLDILSSKTEKKDLLVVYENLNRWSRNHMRAFYKNITRQWWSYEAQYISSEKLSEIINWEQEKGVIR